MKLFEFLKIPFDFERNNRPFNGIIYNVKNLFRRGIVKINNFIVLYTLSIITN